MQLDEDTAYEIRRILTDRRTELGWTQDRLAKKMGVSHSAVSYWEVLGTRRFDVAARWAAALGVRIDLIFTDINERTEAP